MSGRKQEVRGRQRQRSAAGATGRGRSRSPRPAALALQQRLGDADLAEVCSKEFRAFACKAASLLAEAADKRSENQADKDIGKVWQGAAALLEAEEKKGKELSLLRSKVDDLNRRLRALAPPAGIASAKPATVAPAKPLISRPFAGSIGSAVAPWATRRTARPRLLD
eukprot:TRINITY_DN37918_c0_g1_i1.p2 TRINITY_DN37918_c0_g1~~TRINITY_DN37918_c0_g1_i1.p2  ORF type:complete len:190 (+),score=58.30 TRINITY_DN37918_c0_g1_i1:72-572(+)